MSSQSMEEELRTFVAAKTKLASREEITKDTKLFSSGLLTSIIFVELLIFIEKRFAVKIRNRIQPDMRELDSIDEIMRVVESCRSGPGSAGAK